MKRFNSDGTIRKEFLEWLEFESEKRQARIKKIIDLRNQGYTYEKIAEFLKIKKQRAHQLVQVPRIKVKE